MHLKRALILIAALTVLGNVTRFMAVPESFGRYGEFRANHLFEERAREPIHTGSDICGGCHDDKMEEKGGGVHAPIPCENCHFQPYAGHEERPGVHPEVSQSPDRSQRLCLVCHQYFPSRPPGFAQLKNFHEHILTNAQKLPEKDISQTGVNTLCVHCHNPHSPKINLEANG